MNLPFGKWILGLGTSLAISRRWLWAVALLTLLVSTTAVLTTGPVSAADTIVVDADGMATAKSCNSPKTADVETTIQDAIDAASAGDTVLVCPGTYLIGHADAAGAAGHDQHIIIDVAGLKLLGKTHGNQRVIVDGAGHGHTTGGSGFTAPVIRITADGVTVSNLWVRNSGGGTENAGIFIDDADDAIIMGNTVGPDNNCGILLANHSHDAVVQGNQTFGNDSDGIRLDEFVHDNTIRSNNTHDETDDGIEVRDSAFDNDILGNNTHDNGDDGIKVASDAGTGNTVTGNNAHHNGDDGIDDNKGVVVKGTNNTHNNVGDPCEGCVDP